MELKLADRVGWNRALGVGLMCALAMAAGSLFAASTMASDSNSYAELSDAQLTKVLQQWGTLKSSDRRGVLVEVKNRMERSRTRQAQPRPAQAPRIAIYIRVRQTMRYGAGIQNHVGSLRSGGVVVMRGSMKEAGGARLTVTEMLNHMRGLSVRTQRLPGPGFGDGFEQRQAFLQASFAQRAQREPSSASEISANQVRHREQ